IFLASGTVRADLLTTTPGGPVFLGSGNLLTRSEARRVGTNPTGTITFALINPSNSVVDTETVAVSGNGTYNTPVGFVPTIAGTYQWAASYSGDASNLGVSSVIGSEPESVSVATPILNTTPGGPVFLGSGNLLT